MGVKRWADLWPVYRQITGADRLGRGRAVESKRSGKLAPRTEDADRVVHSVCPFCAVGCAQNVYVQDEHVTQIEGSPDSPVSSVASRRAASSSERSAASRWPPVCSHRPTLAWRTRTTRLPSALQTSADAVRWAGMQARDHAFGWDSAHPT